MDVNNSLNLLDGKEKKIQALLPPLYNAILHMQQGKPIDPTVREEMKMEANLLIVYYNSKKEKFSYSMDKLQVKLKEIEATISIVQDIQQKLDGK
ncbi:MAG: hypothetical protein HKM04_06850 [Legionellales bacterium]|nr:hypothetical protein [Legionellales bacterium]